MSTEEGMAARNVYGVSSVVPGVFSYVISVNFTSNAETKISAPP